MIESEGSVANPRAPKQLDWPAAIALVTASTFAFAGLYDFFFNVGIGWGITRLIQVSPQDMVSRAALFLPPVAIVFVMSMTNPLELLYGVDLHADLRAIRSDNPRRFRVVQKIVAPLMLICMSIAGVILSIRYGKAAFMLYGLPIVFVYLVLWRMAKLFNLYSYAHLLYIINIALAMVLTAFLGLAEGSTAMSAPREDRVNTSDGNSIEHVRVIRYYSEGLLIVSQEGELSLVKGDFVRSVSVAAPADLSGEGWFRRFKVGPTNGL